MSEDNEIYTMPPVPSIRKALVDPEYLARLQAVADAAREYVETAEMRIRCSMPGLTARSVIRKHEEKRDALSAALKGLI